MVLLTVAWGSTPAPAQRERDRRESPWQSGLVGRYFDGRQQPVFQRIDETLSFVWPSGDPRLSGPFHATWSGRLQSEAQGKYRLAVQVEGRVQVRLNDQLVLDGQADQPQWLSSAEIELAFGRHPLQIDYHSHGGRGRLALYWEGPQILLEPVGSRQLLHAADVEVDDDSERGRELVRALRCAACHAVSGERSALPAPSLRRLPGNLHAQWLAGWLGRQGPASGSRRMPHLRLQADEVTALVAYLLAGPEGSATPATGAAPDANRAAGEQLFMRVGCLACHRVEQLGSNTPYSGGDLTQIASKRPAGYFPRWLREPEKINRHHRMPRFELSGEERRDLAAYLATLGPAPEKSLKPAPELREAGRRVFGAKLCGRCHEGPDELVEPTDSADSDQQATRLAAGSRWDQGCLGEPPSDGSRPGYRLGGQDAAAVRQYIAQLPEPVPDDRRDHVAQQSGARLLRESNCLSCHARDGLAGLSGQLRDVVDVHPELAARLPAMSPPSLTSVGDKLHHDALAETISRTAEARRPWLDVRMPKFPLNDAELQAIVDYLIEVDRVPRDAPAAADVAGLEEAGRRLVTADGFGCTSCHRVGKFKPPKAPLNAMGPDLSMLGSRIRRTWFDRWVRNPARIVPRMEMPSVQIPVRGVLDDQLDHQLEAVWTVLNQRGFVPPEPNPVRVVRRSGIRERDERAVVATDVLHLDKQVHIKPLLIGLPNRHNVMYDLETGRLQAWWLGDTARQRTQGKTWFWEAGGLDMLGARWQASEWSLVDGQREQAPRRRGQFVTELDWLQYRGHGLQMQHRLHFGSRQSPRTIQVTQQFEPIWRSESSLASGVERRVSVAHGPPQSELVLRLTGEARPKSASPQGGALLLAADGGTQVQLLPGAARLESAARVVIPLDQAGSGQVTLRYLTELPVDQFPVVPPEIPPPPVTPMPGVVPGFDAVRLPLAEDMMPTGLAWRPSGELMITSLKGQVWQARDTDGDEVEDQLQAFSDDVAAPYGVAAAGADTVDVVSKFALLRLHDPDGDGRADRWETLASGWGHTADYHDWAIGLPSDEQGNYYVATACQQDERSAAAARWRGQVLRLKPRTPTADDPRRFRIEPISGGHRFPMGLARRRDGELFVTDNQGNYNPFNELNHVLPGRRYGFINAVERRQHGADFSPPLTPPAIDIPHPWTRSVNGICFLETPPELSRRQGPVFGAYEGHLVGCEYDTRRLIRMSLQRVGDVTQGAAYPLSRYHPVDGHSLLGPLACAVAPDGDLYIGAIRDSGWGGANNIGMLVRLAPRLDQLPAGIAEVRAAGDGFVLELQGPIDAQRAAQADSYSVASYRRISTPAYGGPDVDRRIESIAAATLSSDGRQVRLRLEELREGFVYEIRVQNLAADGGEFFPAEAYYTLRAVP